MKLAFILVFFLTLTACGGAGGSGDSTPENNIPTDTDNGSDNSSGGDTGDGSDNSPGGDTGDGSDNSSGGDTGDGSDNSSGGDTDQTASWDKARWNQFNWQ